MYQASTPTHTWELPFNVNETVEKLLITYFQENEKVLEKTLKDCNVNGNTISVRLSQEETLKFQKGTFKIQLRVVTFGGDSLVSDIWYKTAEEVLDKVVL